VICRYDQRYYASNFGRFMSPDRYKASAGPRDPASWNRYSYVNNDPINALDPSWRWLCNPNMDCTPGGGGPFCAAGEGEGGPQDCTGGGGGGSSPPPPTITLQVIDMCVYPKGTSINPGTWTLEVEYQVYADGQPAKGNNTLTEDGVPKISENVSTISGGPIIGNGVWCLSTETCPEPGSLTSQGTFWDVLAGNGTASQSFMINGQSIKVIFSSSVGETSWTDTFNSKNKSISVGNGAVTGNSTTRLCGTKTGDPAPD
jgi:hypothetical protein